MSKKPKQPVEVVVFNNPEKKKIGNDGQEKTFSKKGLKRKAEFPKLSEPSTSQGPKQLKFDQKQAKYDIRKLGIHGFDKKQKDDAMVDLLVELGARRPKGRKLHIQEYQKIQKQKKKEEQEREEMEQRAGIKKKKEKVKRKRDKDDLLDFIDGQAGFYKDGVQFVKNLKK